MNKKIKIVIAITLFFYISGLTGYFCLKTDDEWFILQTSSDFYPCHNQQVGAIAVTEKDILYVSDIDLGVRVFNASDPINWQEFDSMNNSYNYITQLALTNQYLFLTQYTNLIILNISNPQNLTQVGIYPTSEILQDVVIYESYAIIVGHQILTILNFTNISNISVTEHLILTYGEHGLSLWENYLYIADFIHGVLIYQITDNGTLDYKSRFENYGIPGEYMFVERATKVKATATNLFIADRIQGLVICNRTDPVNINILSHRFITSDCFTIDFDGRFVIIADNIDGIRIVDLINPEDPQTIILDNSHDNCLDVVNINGKIYTLTRNGVGSYKIVSGLGRNPALVLEASKVIFGFVMSTLAILLVIYIINKVKKSEILE